MSANPVAATDDSLQLESMYRQAQDSGREPGFRDAIAERLEAKARDVLTLA